MSPVLTSGIGCLRDHASFTVTAVPTVVQPCQWCWWHISALSWRAVRSHQLHSLSPNFLQHVMLLLMRHCQIQYHKSSIHETKHHNILYMFIFGGIERNPGPRPVKYPCGTCKKACRGVRKRLPATTAINGFTRHVWECHLPDMSTLQIPPLVGYVPLVTHLITQPRFMNQLCLFQIRFQY